jgi:DNA-3-methyladenine glycosylase
VNGPFDPRLLDGASPLPRSFYARPVRAVARDLLGRALVVGKGRRRLSGLIVEVEAYGGARDPASHAYRGETPRNASMFGPPGHAYIYFTYGMHHCLNLVTGRDGDASAVLVRSLQPLEGQAAMARRRGVAARERLARGPGCVARALGLHLGHDGLDLTRGPVWIADLPPARLGRPVSRGPRIGIRLARARPWRFWLGGHPCVSGRRGRSALTLQDALPSMPRP